MTDDRGRSFFIRNLLAGEPLERFLVSAVAAVLGSASSWGSLSFLNWAAAACTLHVRLPSARNERRSVRFSVRRFGRRGLW
jgi:hypothetical protein